MIDQAHKLRALVSEAGPVIEAERGSLPLILVVGGRARVGVTTTAVNLAAVLADAGEATVLVDGSHHANDVCGIAGLGQSVQFGMSDVLMGKCETRDAIVRGPAGMHMLLAHGRDATNQESASRRDAATWGDSSRGAMQRWMNELQSLGEVFDWLVVDGGHANSSLVQRLWSRAKLVIVVTTPEDAAVLDCYAAIKQREADDAAAAVRLLVNRADNEWKARDAQARIAGACQKFLSRSLPALPALPRHCASEFVDTCAPPRVWEMPNSPFGHAMLWLGRAVGELVREEDTVCGEQGFESESFPASCIPHPASL